MIATAQPTASQPATAPIMPWQRARDAFEQMAAQEYGEPELKFERLVGAYIREGGYLWSSPHEFILAVPARIGDGGRVIRVDLDQSPEAWFIHLAATTVPAKAGVNRDVIRQFMRLAPQPLPIIAYHRGPRLVLLPWTRFRHHHN